MHKVKVFLKGWRDSELFTQAVNIDSHPLHDAAMKVFRRSFRAYEPGDITYLAIGYVDATDDEPLQVCERAFERFNVGDPRSDEVVSKYRSRGHRSLSVGDVVVVDGQAYGVASLGFQNVSNVFVRTRFATYAWVIDHDYVDSCAEVNPRGLPTLTYPPRHVRSDVGGPRNIHPNAEHLLRTGGGEPFTLFDDDGIVYYTGRWFEDVNEALPNIPEADLDLDAEPGNPLDDFGSPNAGCVGMHVDGRPYI